MITKKKHEELKREIEDLNIQLDKSICETKFHYNDSRGFQKFSGWLGIALGLTVIYAIIETQVNKNIKLENESLKTQIELCKQQN